MSLVTGLVAVATPSGVSDVGLKTAGAFIGGGLAVGLAATGAAQGDGAVGSAVIAGIARQPEAQGRLMNMFIVTVGICESMYFINLAFMALFVFVLSQG